MVPSPSAGKLNTVLHSNGSWGKVTYADMDEEAVAKIQACPFPVNAIYISTDGKNPATYWPGTTWVAFAMGRCLIGAGYGDGCWHGNQVDGHTSWDGNHSHSLSRTGGGQPHNNMQPSIVVYMFQRTG